MSSFLSALLKSSLITSSRQSIISLTEYLFNSNSLAIDVTKSVLNKLEEN